MDLELQTQEREFGTLAFYVCMFMAIAITQRKSRTATKNAVSSGHHPNFPPPCFRVSLPTLNSPLLRTDHFRISFLTDCFRIPILTDWHPFSFTSGLAGFCRFSSLCGLHANIDKERSSGHCTASKMQVDKIPSLSSHPWTHTETDTH